MQGQPLTTQPNDQYKDPHTGRPQSPGQFRYLWLTLGVLGGLLLLAMLRWTTHLPAPPQYPPIDRQALREQAWEKIQPRLQNADQAMQALVDRSAGNVEQFFDQRKRGVKGFAEAVLSFESKWKLVKSKLPYTDKEGHRAFITEQFRQHIFAAEDLRQVIEQAVADYVHSVEGIENTLLVAIRTDLADFPQGALSHLDTDETFQKAYARMIAEVETSAQADLSVTAAREASSFVAGNIASIITIQVATAVAKKLGLSAGILGTGAASTTMTFGVGLLASIVVDTLADWLLHWYYDPQGKIADKVTATLDQVQYLLIQGDEHTTGLKAETARLGTERTKVRNKAVKRLIRQGS